ncbi:hypothetical protein [Planococcus dechangensis]|uniref:Uncharacterized protein n=1 Tax=Planococcus dechangensis TaxID=1176255 RepID=A0ABV9MAN0_9BACL
MTKKLSKNHYFNLPLSGKSAKWLSKTSEVKGCGKAATSGDAKVMLAVLEMIER